MIHARADQVKSIKNVVADNISDHRYSESHLLRCDLYRTEKMGLNFFKILAADRDGRTCRIWSGKSRMDTTGGKRPAPGGCGGIPDYGMEDYNRNEAGKTVHGKKKEENE